MEGSTEVAIILKQLPLPVRDGEVEDVELKHYGKNFLLDEQHLCHADSVLQLKINLILLQIKKSKCLPGTKKHKTLKIAYSVSVSSIAFAGSTNSSWTHVQIFFKNGKILKKSYFAP